MADRTSSKRTPPSQPNLLPSPRFSSAIQPLAVVPLMSSSVPYDRSVLNPNPIPPVEDFLLYGFPGVQGPVLGSNADTTSLPSSVLTSTHVPSGLRQDIGWSLGPQAWNTRGGCQPTQANGYCNQPSSVTSTPGPAQADVPSPYTFAGVNQDLRDKTKKPRHESARQAAQDTKNAGGSCMWCQEKKKGCGPGTPCKRCERNNKVCIRESTLCLALTSKKKKSVGLDPTNFDEFRRIFRQLKKDISTPLGAVFVEWLLFHDPHQEHRIWTIIDGSSPDFHQEDTVVKNELIDLALSLIPYYDLDYPEYSDSLSSDACRMFKLVAAISQLSRSSVSTQSAAVGDTRWILFLLITIYAEEIFAVSLRFANNFYNDKRNKRLVTKSARYAVRVYSKVIDGIMTFLPSNSSISCIFAPIQPRLATLQDIIPRLLSSSLLETGPNEQDPWIPNASYLDPCEIVIRFAPGRTELFSSAGNGPGICHEQLRYAAETLLRADFDERVHRSCTVPETINPQLLSSRVDSQNVAADYAATSTDIYNSESFGVFSSAVEDSRITDITPSGLDEAELGLFPTFQNQTFDYVVDNDYAVQPSANSDLLQVGKHLSQ